MNTRYSETLAEMLLSSVRVFYNTLRYAITSTSKFTRSFYNVFVLRERDVKRKKARTFSE